MQFVFTIFIGEKAIHIHTYLISHHMGNSYATPSDLEPLFWKKNVDIILVKSMIVAVILFKCV